MSAHKVNKTAKDLFIYVSLLFIILLTAVNINNFLKPKEVKVLGIETKADPETSSGRSFWESFLKIHPNYIPGWIELGRLDKVKEIDPNYF